jgi:cytochrome d ubiquinol oxidase subunit II
METIMMPISYETLRIIWWLLLGFLLVGFAIMDGLDLGIGMLLHHVAKTDSERRITLNTIGPVWEGNQVWLILGAGAIFAAWPTLYAVSFSGLYFGMLIVLLGLILRPVGFKYRSKVHHSSWRKAWDCALFLGGFLPAFVFGIVIGNVLQGVPFYFDAFLRIYYQGTFFDLLNPFALPCGCLSISMLCMQGGLFLCIKTNGILQSRAAKCSLIAGGFLMLCFSLAGYWIAYGIKGYSLMTPMAHDGFSNPLLKEVTVNVGAWLNNYKKYPSLLMVPALGFLGAMMSMILIKLKYFRTAFLMSSLSIAALIATVGVSLFPFILPSSKNPSMSLLIWDASSSQTTLFIMLLVTLIFMPIIIAYTSWVYYVLRGKITDDYVQQRSHQLY